VTAAGFAEPEIEEVKVEWEYDDPSVHWEKTMKLAAPIAEAMNSLPEAERERIRELVASRVSEQLSQDQASLHGHTWVISTS
jgi:hypothetical protein